jgi:hypothetical protein
MMGERDFYQRYKTARHYADEQAAKYTRGDPTDTYRGLTGAAWVAEAYDIAAEDARAVVQTQGHFWQPIVDECRQLAEQYREKARRSTDGTI